MALVNHAKGEINAKIVYYGPGLSGKGTNLNYIYRKLKPENRGKLKTMNVGKDRMLFFDFTPAGQGKLADYNVRFHAYSIVGDVTDNTAWKMVLKGVDGLVFVADSSAERMAANVESLDELRKIMRSYGMSVKDLPGVLQCNKRDADNPLPMAEMENTLNYGGFTVLPAVAGKGEGVLESLFKLMKDVLKNIRESGDVPGAEPETTAAPEAAAQPATEEEPPLAETAPAAEEPPEMEPVSSAPVEEPAVTASPLEEVMETAPPAAPEPEVESAPEPVIEIAGAPEQIAVGRIRLPLKIRCGDTVKEIPIVITVGLDLE
jgi:signal recognition particle receptor subunit beta